MPFERIAIKATQRVIRRGRRIGENPGIFRGQFLGIITKLRKLPRLVFRKLSFIATIRSAWMDHFFPLRTPFRDILSHLRLPPALAKLMAPPPEPAIFQPEMFKPDDFNYAMANTQVILAPERRIESFGNVNFHFYLISELMDEANRVRVRDGQIQADRPEIAMLRYGFQFRKSGVVESIVNSTVEQVVERVREQVTASMEPSSAIIQGVDDAWEVCLLKFTMELVQQSAGGNMGDFRKRGLI
jgi:hypothetical protein